MQGKKNTDVMKLNSTAMLVAMEFILTRYLKIMLGNVIRISFGFLPMAAVSILYGPWWSGVAFAISDIIGATLIPIGVYHPGFTASAFLTAFIYGIFLHKKEITWKNIAMASFVVVFGVQLLLDTFWLTQILHKGIWALLPGRFVKAVIMFPVQVILIRFMWTQLLSKIPYVQKVRKEQRQ